jgi:2-oxoglutarate ferredoxin oxidoreductase subunit gamma
MSPAPRVEVRFAGTGGQGLILAAKMLAQALAAQGRAVAQSQLYEPTSRGGSCNADLVVADSADTEVDYPLATALGALVLLDAAGTPSSWPLLQPGAWVLADTRLCPQWPDSAGLGLRAHALPLTRTAIDLGSERVANIVALGALTALTGLCTRATLEQTVRSDTPRAYVDLNLDALAAGWTMGQALLQPEPAAA